MDALDRLERCLQAIGETEGRVKAWVMIDEDGAMQAAKRAKGPLAGLPVGIKDVIDVEGWPTKAGTKVLSRARPAVRDAPSVAALRQAGAVIIGKTNTHEFAYGYATPPTKNPWDPGRIPGGSSGGSAAAVAASHCEGALGTDTGGSIRVPASLCGVSGLKPAPGRTSLEGVIPLAPPMDSLGPIARDVSTIIDMWNVLAGDDVRESESFKAPVKLGIISLDRFPELDAGVATAFADSLPVLGAIAESLIDVDVQSFGGYDSPRRILVMSAALKIHTAAGWWPRHAAKYSEASRRAMEFAEQEISEADIQHAHAEVVRLLRPLVESFGRATVIATPTVSCIAPTHEEATFTPANTGRPLISLKLARIVSVANLANLTAISVPCGFSDGMPVGLHLMGKDAGAVLSVAERYQRETDWHTVRPGSMSQ